MRALRRLATPKRASRIRSVGRLRIDAAAELLRLEYEMARLAAMRGRLAGGLARTHGELAAAEARIVRVMRLLAADREASR